MQLLRAVPVKKRNDHLLMRRYLTYLKENNILIFYQGGRSFDLSRCRHGPGWIVARSEEPPVVIPVYIEGLSKVFGGPGTKGLRGRWLPKSIFRRMVIAFGDQIDFSDLVSVHDIKERTSIVNSRIIEAVKSLKNQHST